MSELKDKSSWANLMPENKKLYWKDGHTNLIPWQEDIQTYGLLIFPESIVKAVFADKEIPLAWEREWSPPLIAPTDKFAIALTLKERDEHNDSKAEWERYKGKVTSFLTLTQTDSSKIRVDKYHEQAIKDHIFACKAVEILNLIEQTHTFSGAVSSFDDREKTEVEWMTFHRLDNNEKLESYSNRYYKMLEKCDKMGIKTQLKKKRVYRYLNGLRDYNKSALVQLNVLTYLSLVDKTGFPKILEDVIDELIGLDQSENPVGTQQTNSNKFAVNLTTKIKSPSKGGKKRKYDQTATNTDPESPKEITFPDGTSKGLQHPDGQYQIFAMAGISKKFKRDSEAYQGLFKPSHVTKPNKGGTKFQSKKPKTSKEAQKLKDKHPNKTWKEIYKMITCGKCGWTGHVDEECPKKDQSNDSSSHRNVSSMRVLPEELPLSQAAMRNTSGYFAMNMTHAFSKPITMDQAYNELLQQEKNQNYLNLDGHSNIHVFSNEKLTTNIRKVRPIKVKGFGGFIKTLDTVGDHPLLGEVFIDKENGYNIVSCDLARTESGYFRRTSKDNLKEFLYNEDLKSVFTFDRDPVDGFYKCSVRDFNREMIRCFPNVCQSIS